MTQVYKPQYYYFGYDWIGTVGETASPSNPSTEPPTGKNFYLGYDVTDGKVSSAYACFTRNDVEYCLKGYDTEAFSTNNTVLEDAFKDVENACSFDAAPSRCSADGLNAVVNSYGMVAANEGIDECNVNSGGDFACYE